MFYNIYLIVLGHKGNKKESGMGSGAPKINYPKSINISLGLSMAPRLRCPKISQYGNHPHCATSKVHNIARCFKLILLVFWSICHLLGGTLSNSMFWHTSLTVQPLRERGGDTLPFLLPFSRPALGSDIVDPTTVRPESSAALATADAKSASARNDPSELESADDRFDPQLSELSVTDAQEATRDPKAWDREVMYNSCLK